ncbi:hypothetical protein [Saccharomonospora glauca]|jgi:hypothetical protein|uniref:Uncharacterized protein n=1 Tax=Saccharomonospora glauca K62 TaxID=928724 RepID=I1CYT1_9PSEU|nr:hypothetical protein [Saccharomonospora glauca]EIE97855.1 hypothetical protein SacglDRAFT_00917 [Saccharomonospora glauca K62]
MRDIDIDPTRNDADPGDATSGASTVSGRVDAAAFDDDDDLEPTIVRGLD